MATPLNIKDPEAYQLASEIAQHTGKTLTRVVVDALKHEKEALKPASQEIDMAKVHELLAKCMPCLRQIHARATISWVTYTTNTDCPNDHR